MSISSAQKFSAAVLVALSLSMIGCMTDDDDGDDTSDPVTTKTLTAGAQANATYGSSIDLDDFQAHTASVARNMGAEIDLIFAHSTSIVGGTSAIYSPRAAKEGIDGSAGFDFMQDFNTTNVTAIRTVAGVNINVITKKSQVDSLWDISSPVANGRLIISTGSTFLARSNEDRIVLVRVNNVVQGDSGTAQFEGVAKF